MRSIRYRLVNRDALYDMRTDPGQKENVFEDHPDVAEAMLAAFDSWWQETVPMMVNESAPLAPAKPFHELYHQQMAEGGIPDWQPPPL